MKGLAKQPAERYDDCASFARAVLGEVPEGLPEDTKVQSAAAPAEPRVSQGEAGRVRCPVCSKGIAFGPKHAGRSIRCPKCETKRRVGNNLRSLTEVVPVTESTTGPADATMQLGAVETVKVAANRDDPGVAPPHRRRASGDLAAIVRFRRDCRCRRFDRPLDGLSNMRVR